MMRLKIIFLISILLNETNVRGDFFGDKREIVYDLLQAAMATSENKNQYIDDGLDGFPVFGFRPGSEVKQPYRLYLPEKLPAEFTLVATFKPMSLRTSYLFAVLNPFETVVQLGIRISDGSASNQNISLVYTNSDQHSHSEEISKFTVPKLLKKWSKIVIKVSTSDVTLYLHCHEMGRQRVTRLPQELVFDTASTLYIAQAGPHIQEKYDGLLQSLKLYPGHPQDLIRCTTDFELFPIEFGSGDESSTTPDDNISVGEGEGSGAGFIDFDKFGQEDNEDTEKSEDIKPPPLITPPPPNSIAKGAKGEKGDRGPPGPPGPAIYDPIVVDDTRRQGSPIKNDGNDDDEYTGEREQSAGSKGEPGSCSCNATALLESFIMPKMIQGPKGEPGLMGKEGKPGRMGLTGAAGPSGERGRTGAIGEKGVQGNVGKIGPEGPEGPKGAPGRDGIPGEKGQTGQPGPPGKAEFSVHDDGITMRPGLPGPKGNKGETGNGSKGEPGIPGPKGNKGELGSRGGKGDNGKDGPRGLQGFKGEPGAPGTAGIPGENGRHADKGEKGDAGPEGKTGPAGPPGNNGLLNSAEGGASPGLSDTHTGGLASKGEAGPPGEKGDLGPKGEKGDRGESIRGLPGLNGPLGDKGDPGKDGINGVKGDRGERGPPGETVFSGSGDYIAIKGEKGAEGKRGRRGRPGSPGPVGPPGKSGSNGEIGLPGWIGRPGNPGVSGSPGPKGEKGNVGLKGEPGKDGQPAIQGNYVPIAGPPGPPGPPGNPGSPGLSLISQKGEPVIGRSHLFEGERDYYASRQEARISEIKALQELKQLKELKEHLGGAAAAGPSVSRPLSITTKIVPGAVTFQNSQSMTKMSSVSAVGTLAYIIDEEALLVRVNNGWQYIALGSLLPITTPTPPTTFSSPLQPNHPFEASNLINQMPMKADGTGWYPKMLRMVALNEPSTGDMHGIRGADYACYRQSKRAGLKGTFRAFLSSRVQNVDSIVRLGDRDLPIVNIKGDVLFNSWKDMFNGNGAYFSQNPRIYSFNGKNILSDLSWPEKVVWHGSHKLGDRAMDTFCDAWHSANADRYGLGSPLTGGKLLEQIRYSCNNKFALLCIEVAASSETTHRKRKRSTLTDEYHELMDENDKFQTDDDYIKHVDKIMKKY